VWARDLSFKKIERRYRRPLPVASLRVQLQENSVLIEIPNACTAYTGQSAPEPESQVAGEVRQMMDDFGLTPKGRQMRGWVISEKDAERAGGSAPTTL
jgi:hypothetical protein